MDNPATPPATQKADKTNKNDKPAEEVPSWVAPDKQAELQRAAKLYLFITLKRLKCFRFESDLQQLQIMFSSFDFVQPGMRKP